MKNFRLLAAALLAFTLSQPALAQESGEITSLRAKALKGNGIAQYNLGLAYAEGRGLAADPVEAFVWLSLAQENGARGRALDSVVGNLDPAALEVAQKRLAERRAAFGASPTAPSPTLPAPEEAPKPAADPTALAAKDRELKAALEGQLASARQELAAKPGAPAQPRPVGSVAQLERVQELEAQLAQAKAQAAAPAYPDLSGRVTELETQLAQIRAQPAAVDLSGRVRELEGQLVAAEDKLTAASRAPTPTTPDLSGRVNELTSEVTQLRAVIARLEQDKGQLAAAPAATPAYPDLSGKVAELEAELAQSRAAARAPAYPDLSGRVNELETALAAARQQPAAIPAATGTPTSDNSELAQKLAATEDRLATSLRGFALLQRERDAQTENADKSSAALTAERDALAAQVSRLNGQVEQLGRLGETVAALQRTQAQAAKDLAATRALAQQLQGANSVLAGENYQLKTKLARPAGGAAVTAAAAPASSEPAPAMRTHLVATGDSLARIAQRYYGNANRWQEIYNANSSVIGPNGALRIGTQLRVP